MTNSDRFNALLADVAKQLDLPESSDTVNRLALLKFAREALAVRLIDNVERIDTGELLELDRAIVAMTPAAVTEHTVKIKLVPSTDKHVCRACMSEHCIEPTCKMCGFRQYDDLVRWREHKAAAPGVEASAPVAQASKPTAHVPAAAAPAAKVVPIRKPGSYTPPPAEPTFTACTVVKGIPTDQRWTK